MDSSNKTYFYKRGARPKQSFLSEESSPSAMAALSGNRLVSYGSHDNRNRSTLRVEITNNSYKKSYNSYSDTPVSISKTINNSYRDTPMSISKTINNSYRDTPMSISKTIKNNNALYQYPKCRSRVAEYISKKTYLTDTSDNKIYVNIKEENVTEICRQNGNDSHSSSSFKSKSKSQQNCEKTYVTNAIKTKDCQSLDRSSSSHSEKCHSQVESLIQNMSNLTVIDEDVTTNIAEGKKVVSKVTSDDCICCRTVKLLHCRYCGHMLRGRVSMPCSKHPKNVFLMDVTACPKCRSPACECLSEVDTVTGVIVAPLATTTAAAARAATALN